MTDRRAFLAAAIAAPVALSAPALAAPTFDPAAWVRQYLDLGGTISIRAGGVWYAYAPENEAVCRFVMDCNRIPGQWEAVRAYANTRFA